MVYQKCHDHGVLSQDMTTVTVQKFKQIRRVFKNPYSIKSICLKCFLCEHKKSFYFCIKKYWYCFRQGFGAVFAGLCNIPLCGRMFMKIWNPVYTRNVFRVTSKVDMVLMHGFGWFLCQLLLPLYVALLVCHLYQVRSLIKQITWDASI